MTAHAEIPSTQLATPETYLDDQRSQTFMPALKAGTHSYPGFTSTPGVNEFALKGTWTVGSQSATPVSRAASITGGVQAAKVYLVMTSAGNVPRQVRILLDGKPIPARAAGADVHGGVVTVRGQRLYSLVSLRQAEQHGVTVQVPPGVSAYDFTFG
jgi:hypothetical protein